MCTLFVHVACTCYACECVCARVVHQLGNIYKRGFIADLLRSSSPSIFSKSDAHNLRHVLKHAQVTPKVCCARAVCVRVL